MCNLLFCRKLITYKFQQQFCKHNIYINKKTQLVLLSFVAKCSRGLSVTKFRAASSYVAHNEPMYDFAPGSQERKDLAEAMKKYDGNVVDIPIVIGEEEIRTKDVRRQVAVCIFHLCINITLEETSIIY